MESKCDCKFATFNCSYSSYSIRSKQRDTDAYYTHKNFKRNGIFLAAE